MPDSSLIGTHVGRYHVVKKLGEGGMGSVWKAEDTLLRRTVALKFLSAFLEDSAESRRRFMGEARAASLLDHPSIATVFDAGEIDGRFYIAGSFVDGKNLSERLDGSPLEISEAVRIAAEAAEALDHAHVHGVIHRDLTARNIMISVDGRVVVVDFGLALRAGGSRITPADGVLGTFGYMAPEMFLGDQATARSDVYSLGVVLYEMLTGTLPHRAQRPEALMHAILNDVIEGPSAVQPTVPRELDRICLKALAKEATQRHPTAGELADDLRALEGTTIPAKREREAAPTPATIADTRLAPIPESICLAVMPFRDLTLVPRRSRKSQLVARGLAETVSGSLGAHVGLQVIPPLESLYSGQGEIGEVARRLGANLVLSGTVQRSGEHVRVTYSVIHPERKAQVAGDVIDGSIGNLLDLENRLVSRIARAIGVERVVSPEVGAVHARDPAAHEHYLQARGDLMRYDNEASVNEAIELLEGLIESEGESARHCADLGRAYLRKYQLTLQPRWEGKAEACCQRALELDADSPEVLVTLGEVHRLAGRYKESVGIFQRVIEKRPAEIEALLGLAGASERLGCFENAERYCLQAIAMRPRYWAGHNRLGAIYYRRGQYQRAIGPWMRVVEIAPDNARGHNNLGAAYYHLGRHDEAISAYRRSLDIRPTATAFSSLGTIHFFQGNDDEAVAMFERGAALSPFDAKMWGNLADVYRWQACGEERAAMAYDQAITLVREQLDLNPNSELEGCRLAVWLAKRGNADEASEALSHAKRSSLKDVNAMALLVTCHELLGQREEAFEWLQRAVVAGYDTTELERDPELASLRRDSRFDSALGKEPA